jgi:hypothetical protein
MKRQLNTLCGFCVTGHQELFVGNDLKVEGDLSGRDGLVRFVKGQRLLAVATIERDLSSLNEERAWEITGGPAASPN